MPILKFAARAASSALGRITRRSTSSDVLAYNGVTITEPADSPSTASAEAAMPKQQQRHRLGSAEDRKQTQAFAEMSVAHVLSQSTTASPLPNAVPSASEIDYDFDDGDDAIADYDHKLTLWTMDSLALSECIEDDAPEVWGGKPPAMPQHSGLNPHSPFDGEWSLCNVAEGHSTWLRSLAIQDAEVLDGNGKMCSLRGDRHRPTLFGGVLKRKGAALVRVGKTGSVQVYLRRQSA